jgi:hypothetical protein
VGGARVFVLRQRRFDFDAIAVLRDWRPKLSGALMANVGKLRSGVTQMAIIRQMVARIGGHSSSTTERRLR